MAVEVADAPEAKRYEARVDGASAVAGFAQYIRTDELVAFVHTEVAPEYEGKGVGSALVRSSSTKPVPRACGYWRPVRSTRAGFPVTRSTGTWPTSRRARSATERPEATTAGAETA